MERIKTADKSSVAKREAKKTKVGWKETDKSKAELIFPGPYNNHKLQLFNF